MERHLVVKERKEGSLEERLVQDLARRVRKLRWMRMEDEAEQLQWALRALRPKSTLLAEPGDTD